MDVADEGWVVGCKAPSLILLPGNSSSSVSMSEGSLGNSL